MATNPLELAKKALDQAINQKKLNEEFVKSVGPAIVSSLKPTLNAIANNAKMPKDDLVKAISNIKLPPINIPDIKVPEPRVNLTVPEQPAPIVNVPEANIEVKVPEIKVPDVKMPEEMEIRGWINVMGYDKGLLNDPLPVQLRDANGRPVNMFGDSTNVIGGGGGGKTDHFTIKGFGQSAFSEITNPDGRLKVELPTGSSGLTDTELRAAHLDVLQLSGSIDSVYVTNTVTVDTELPAAGALADNMANPTTPLTGSCLMGWDGGGWDRLSGSSAGGLNVNAPNGVRIVDAGGDNVTDDATNTVKVSDGGGSLTIDGTVAVSGVSGTTGANIVDSTGVAYSGSNRLPTRPINARGSMQTAYVEEDEIEEVTLLTGVASEYHDLVYLMAANSSDAAITLDIRQSTGGTVQMTVDVPANGTAGVACPVPIPQDHQDASWTVKNNATDNSNTVYAVTALFSKEV